MSLSLKGDETALYVAKNIRGNNQPDDAKPPEVA